MRIAVAALAYSPELDPFDADDAYEIARCSRREGAVRSAIKLAAEKNAQALWFSGYTAAVSRLSDVGSTGVLKALRQEGLGGVFELVEPVRGGNGLTKGRVKGAVSQTGLQRAFYVHVPGRRLTGPLYQCVVRSNEATWTRLSELTKDLRRGGARRFEAEGIDCSLLICGESNILRTSRDSKRTNLRYEELDGWLEYRLIFNPQHSVWRRSEIDKRMEFLSMRAPGQFAVSCSNYPNGKEHFCRIIQIACNGSLDDSKGDWLSGDGFILRVFDF